MTRVNTILSKVVEGAGTPAASRCFHCGLPVADGAGFSVVIAGRARPMCCAGCQAVAQAIVHAGQEAFYRHRTAHSTTGRELLPEFLRQTGVYDHPAVQKSFVTRDGWLREAHLIIEGIVCAACVWLNEQYLRRLPGVQSVQINYATRRARIRWDDSRIHLSAILQAVSEIGYTAHPYDPYRQQQLMEAERNGYLRRLGVAGVLGMQVMMIAVALYAGAWSGMETGFRVSFHWVSLGLAAPVVLYAAQPFFRAAWLDLRRRTVGMDVPVALAITLAFAASAWTTMTGSGAVYYDSVVMFVFFLLTARYLELGARRRAMESLDAIAHRVPASATRVGNAGTQEVVPVVELRPGDRVLIRPGETVPADGTVNTGVSSVDESLISGESLPVVRKPGDRLIGGSANQESVLEMQVDRVGEQTVLSGIVRLLERAQMEKPALVLLADRVASWFVGGVLLFAAAVAMTWYLIEPVRWLPVTIAVLVVTCPCALSLATPAAVTAAIGRLAGLGLLITRGHVLETLAKSTHVIFDKTGTLTTGRLSLVRTETFAELSAAECLRRAAALEQFSEHPIAAALLAAAGDAEPPAAHGVSMEPGAGVQGVVSNQIHYVGTLEFIRTRTGVTPGETVLRTLGEADGTVVLLGTNQKVLAGFVLRDTIRSDAVSLIQELTRSGRQIMILSGDHEAAVRGIAAALAIDRFAWSLRPEDKLDHVKQLQRQGAVVAMVGDGVNDAPVLAQAQVSIAMGGGAPLAAVSADVLLVSERITHIATGLRVAVAAQRIIRQNLTWAAGYNLLALPAAAMGLIAPWAAAIGMSASSLLVVANALRLRRTSPWK